MPRHSTLVMDRANLAVCCVKYGSFCVRCYCQCYSHSNNIMTTTMTLTMDGDACAFTLVLRWIFVVFSPACAYLAKIGYRDSLNIPFLAQARLAFQIYDTTHKQWRPVYVQLFLRSLVARQTIILFSSIHFRSKSIISIVVNATVDEIVDSSINSHANQFMEMNSILFAISTLRLWNNCWFNIQLSWFDLVMQFMTDSRQFKIHTADILRPQSCRPKDNGPLFHSVCIEALLIIQSKLQMASQWH